MPRKNKTYVTRYCDGCEVEFQAINKGKYNTTNYCPECVKKKVWMKPLNLNTKSKGRDKIPKAEMDFIKKYSTFED